MIVRAYDAEYIAPTRQLNVPLLTTGQLVLQQFPAVATSPERFLAGE